MSTSELHHHSQQPRVAHPLIDDAGAGWVLTRTEDPVVALTTLLSDLLSIASAQQVHVIVETPSHVRLTHAAHRALISARALWVVRTEEGLRSGRSGRRLLNYDDALRPDKAQTRQDISPDYLAAALVTVPHLEFTTFTRHNPTSGALLGGPTEGFAQAIDSSPAYWGATEPFVAKWNRRDLTDHSRARVPAPSMWSSVDEARTVTGVIRVRRTDVGIEENSHTLIRPETRDDAELRDIARAGLTSFAGYGVPLAAYASIRVGPSDLTVRSTFVPPPAPVGVVIGAPGVRASGRGVEWWKKSFDAQALGNARTPSIAIIFGTDSASAPADEQRFYDTFDVDTRVAMGLSVPSTLSGGDHAQK